MDPDIRAVGLAQLLGQLVEALAAARHQRETVAADCIGQLGDAATSTELVIPTNAGTPTSGYTMSTTNYSINSRRRRKSGCASALR